jgi:hypothetical protein
MEITTAIKLKPKNGAQTTVEVLGLTSDRSDPNSVFWKRIEKDVSFLKIGSIMARANYLMKLSFAYEANNHIDNSHQRATIDFFSAQVNGNEIKCILYFFKSDGNKKNPILIKDYDLTLKQIKVKRWKDSEKRDFVSVDSDISLIAPAIIF